MGTASFQRDFQTQKLESSQQYELARTAAEAGRKLALTGPTSADADFHIQNQTSYLRMGAFVRMMERNDPIVASAAQRLMAGVNVGQMSPSPDTGDEDVDNHLKSLWDEYASDPSQCDDTGRMDYETQADVAYIRTIFDGDTFCVPQDNGSCLNLEFHRCQTPHRSKIDRGVCGVRTDGKRPTHYFLTHTSTAYGQIVRVSDVEEIPARNKDGWSNVFHTFRPQRFHLNRGVTSLAPVGTAAARRDDNEFAMILKNQIASCISFVEDISDVEMFKLLKGQGTDQVNPLPTTFTQTDDAGFQMRTAALHPGRVLEPRPGRKLTMHTPNIPGEGFFDLNLLLIRYLAICLDLPLFVLMLDGSDTNLSSWRGTVDQARATYSKHQRWFASQYHRPRWKHFVRTRLREGDVVLRKFVVREKLADPRKSAIYRHQWNPVGWKYIHPVDDAQGDVLLTSNSLDDLDRFARRKHGISGEEHIRRVVKYNRLAVTEALRAKAEIESEFPDAAIDWQYLWSPPNRQGLNLQMADRPDAQPEGEGA